MLSGFTLYISMLRYLGKYEICGCGGILNGLSYATHLIININLIIAALFVQTTLSKKTIKNEN